jgi:hypothetical protein
MKKPERTAKRKSAPGSPLDNRRVSFRSFDPSRIEDCSLVARWENDPEIRELFRVFPDESSHSTLSAAEKIAQQRSSPAAEGTHAFLIQLDGRPVGEINIRMIKELA